MRKLLLGLIVSVGLGYPDGFFCRPGTLWLGTGPRWATVRPAIVFTWRKK